MIVDNTIILYKAILVKLIFKYPKIGAFIPIRLTTSNWSNGDWHTTGKELPHIIVVFNLCIKRKYPSLLYPNRAPVFMNS